jgi:hypothetical protein
MSKFLLNLLLQISKALIHSKNQIVIRKRNFPHFRPNRPSSLPAQPRPFFSFPTGHSPPSPLGLGLSAGPAHPHGPTTLFFLLTAPPERRLPACTAATTEAPRPPPSVQDPPPSKIKPQPLPPPPLNQSFMAHKSPLTPPPVSPLMPAIIAARHPPRAPIKGEPPPRSITRQSPSPSSPLPHQNTPPPSSAATTTSP